MNDPLSTSALLRMPRKLCPLPISSQQAVLVETRDYAVYFVLGVIVGWDRDPHTILGYKQSEWLAMTVLTGLMVSSFRGLG